MLLRPDEVHVFSMEESRLLMAVLDRHRERFLSPKKRGLRNDMQWDFRVVAALRWTPI